MSNQPDGRASNGGPRPGSGRKPGPPEDRKVPRCIELARIIDDYLRQCPNATEMIETAITRSKQFRAWRKNL